MEGGRFDASAYMLVEASGDSEAGYFDGAAEAESGAAAEDDAQSCSYGSLSDSAAVDDAGGDADFDDCDGEEEYGGRNSDEEDGVVDQWSVVPAAAKEKLNHEQKACEDSNLKVMNERETDRLFWEACLAS